MRVLVMFVLGALLAVGVWQALAPSLQRAPFLVQNYRKISIPTAGGLVLPLVVMLVVAMTQVAAAAGWGGARSVDDLLPQVLALTMGFALFGLLDDLAAVPGDRGFKGHVRALLRGRLTTGGLKLLGGAVLGIAVAGWVRPAEGVGMLLVDGAVIALGANLTNLFDLAPGRTTKASLLGFLLLLAACGADHRLAGAAVVMGAVVGLAPFDLRERMMLGDTGANVLGSVLGLGAVALAGASTRVVVLAALVALTVVGDQVGFSRIIRSVAPLRFVDQLGRRR